MEDIKQTFDTNAYSILRVCKAVVPIMAKRRSGTIVNIGSIVGEMCVYRVVRILLHRNPHDRLLARHHGMACTALPRRLLTASARFYPWN